MNKVEIFDCTLRDGGNVVGKGFSLELTRLIIAGLLDNGVKTIEYGHPSGIGGYRKGAGPAPVADLEYLEAGKPFFGRGKIGMFAQPSLTVDADVEKAAEMGLGFLRVGTNAGDAASAGPLTGKIIASGMEARFSLMKAYVLPPDKLADEARKVESFGAVGVTIMDSAGCMFPDQVRNYAEVLSRAVKIPVGIHSHNNMGLCVANALGALEGGALSVDTGLMGMARSVGNIPTEVMTAALHRLGKAEEVDLYGLIAFIDGTLAPRMEEFGYKAAISTLELILGYSGCHSNFLNTFREVARERKVDLYRLIVEVSRKDRKSPSRELMETVALNLK
ncbi:MAG: 4-hydroxy-2-oxovalerate aldolase [Synergistaceae bacterium]|jgi:4-hydroxy-2-oxovalerate aldolase|nr:4-hydroxy-2-oxovalerate aldolase [Synergistaceae bacterium]